MAGMSAAARKVARMETSSTEERGEIDVRLRQILIDILLVDAEIVAALEPASGLFGALPEIDSMAVAHLFTGIEDCFDITVDDDDVDGEMLETYGGLRSFVERKVAEA